MSDDCKIIDISHHQGTPDFDAVALAGVIAMIHKATQGTSNVDDCRAENIVNATAAGIACCTYHFLEHGDIEEQMAHYLDVVEPVEGERMVIDWEDWPGHSTVTAADLVEAVRILLDDERGLQVTVYGSESKLNELLSDLDADEVELLSKTSLWIAHYGVSQPGEWPSDIWPSWTLFQYTDQGDINGVEGSSVDLNRFNGSDENLIKWISPADGGEPAPGPEPEPSESVHINIQTSERVVVTVAVNGEVIVGTNGLHGKRERSRYG
jgi:lysozyme